MMASGQERIFGGSVSRKDAAGSYVKFEQGVLHVHMTRMTKG